MPEIMSTLPETLEKARSAYHSGRFSEAERLCTGILAVNGESPEVLHLLALTQSELGRNDAALDNYDRALAIRPEFVEALNNRGVALEAIGQTEAARADFERALRMDPGLAEARLNLQKLPER